MKTEIEMQTPSTHRLELLVLGEMLCLPSGGEIDIVASIVSADMFTSEQTKKVWSLIVDEHLRGLTPDIVTIGSQVGAEFITTMMSAVNAEGISYLNLTRHADALRNAYVHKKANEFCLQMLKMANDLTSTEAELSEAARIFADNADNGHIGSLAKSLSEVSEELCKIHEEGKATGVTTGFPKLDRLYRGGFPPGSLIVLAGRPGTGKTSIGCFMMKKAAISGAKAVMFSLEQTNSELCERLMQGTGQLDPELQPVSKEYWDGFENSLRILEKLPILLVDTSRSIEDICFRIMALKRQGKCDIAFIDYLGLIPTNIKDGMTKAQAVGEITGRLKSIAMELRIPIVLMSQLNREMSKEHRPPELHDLRDSGNIEQDADKVLMIEKTDSYLKLWIRKNRHGKGGEYFLNLKSDEIYCNFFEG